MAGGPAERFTARISLSDRISARRQTAGADAAIPHTQTEIEMRQSIVSIKLLDEAPSLFSLVVVRGVSSVGDWLYLAALPILVYQATGDIALVGLVAAGRLLPWLIMSIPAGVVVDRLSARRSCWSPNRSVQR